MTCDYDTDKMVQILVLFWNFKMSFFGGLHENAFYGSQYRMQESWGKKVYGGIPVVYVTRMGDNGYFLRVKTSWGCSFLNHFDCVDIQGRAFVVYLILNKLD